MSKARRRVKSRRRTLSTGAALVIIGLAVIAVVVLIALTGGTKESKVKFPTVPGQAFETGLTADGFPYKGASDAPVTIVVYSDYQCPHCRDFALEVEPLIDQNYIATGKVKLVAPYFALWPESQPMVAAAMCAAEQGRFWAFDHILYANQDSLEAEAMPTFAQQIGLDVDAFDTCWQSSATMQQVQTFTHRGNAAGIHGTPTFFINGQRFTLSAQPSFFEQFRLEIERRLAGASQ